MTFQSLTNDFMMIKLRVCFSLWLELQVEAENVMMILSYKALLFIRFFLLLSRLPPSVITIVEKKTRNTRPEAHFQA